MKNLQKQLKILLISNCVLNVLFICILAYLLPHQMFNVINGMGALIAIVIVLAVLYSFLFTHLINAIVTTKQLIRFEKMGI